MPIKVRPKLQKKNERVILYLDDSGMVVERGVCGKNGFAVPLFFNADLLQICLASLNARVLGSMLHAQKLCLGGGLEGILLGCEGVQVCRGGFLCGRETKRRNLLR